MRNNIIYWVSTGLLSLMMLASATMYFVQTAMVKEIFESLGYPARLVLPLATLKILGIIAIISNKNKTLKEWAYFGFLLDYCLALEGHLTANDGDHTAPIIAIVLLMISYTYSKKLNSNT